MRWASASPSPTPPRRPVAKGWKRRVRISSGSPGPRSSIAISTPSGSGGDRDLDRPPPPHLALGLRGVVQQVAHGPLEELRIAAQDDVLPSTRTRTSTPSSAGSAAARRRRRSESSCTPRGARPGEGEEVLEHPLEVVGLAADLGEEIGDRVLVRPPLDQGQIAAQGGEAVAQLVGDAAGHLAELRQALGEAPLLGPPLRRGEIGEEDEQAAHARRRRGAGGGR